MNQDHYHKKVEWTYPDYMTGDDRTSRLGETVHYRVKYSGPGYLHVKWCSRTSSSLLPVDRTKGVPATYVDPILFILVES